jgi:transposase-like protein
MTYRNDFTLPAELMEQVAEQGLEILPVLIRIVVNAAMQAECSKYLQAEHYQHTPERSGHANKYKPKTLRTRVVTIFIRV